MDDLRFKEEREKLRRFVASLDRFDAELADIRKGLEVVGSGFADLLLKFKCFNLELDRLEAKMKGDGDE